MGFSAKWKKIIKNHLLIKRKQGLMKALAGEFEYKIFLTPFNQKELIGEDPKLEKLIIEKIKNTEEIGIVGVWIFEFKEIYAKDLPGKKMKQFGIFHGLKEDDKFVMINTFWPLQKIGDEYSGRGIGSEVMKFILEDLKKEGFKLITGGITSNREYSAIPLLEKFGFEAMGKIRNKNGKLYAEYAWVKII